MRVSFLGVQTEVPDDWHDRSTLTFVVPPNEVDSAEGISPGNVVINWSLGPGGPESVFSFLDLQLAQLPAHLQAFELIERGDLGGVGSPAPYACYTFSIGRAVQQIVCVRHIRDHFVVVTGTALVEHFNALRERFVEVALKLEQAPGT